jgi:uncharacterized protein (DUF1330 family)
MMRGHTTKHLIDRVYTERYTAALYSSGGTLHTVKVAWSHGNTSIRSFRSQQAARNWIDSLPTKETERGNSSN